MSIRTVTSKGQITRPKDVRLKLHLEKGEKVDFQINKKDGTATLTPLKRRINDVFGNIKASGNIQGNAVFIDGEKVLGEQENSISNVLGNSVGDNADAINDILSVLRNHGLIKR